MMEENEIEIKKICLERMTYAVLYSVAMQYILLILFLLLVNFNLYHPFVWIGNSFSALFSIYTWIWTAPLISSILIYGIFLCKSYLSKSEYFPTRYHKLRRKILHKIGFFVMHVFVGILTAWLYTKFLSDEYKLTAYKCEDNNNCLNEKYVFIVLNGMFSGIYYFYKENNGGNSILKFPIVRLPKYIQIRSHFYSIFYQSMVNTILSTLCYLLGYILVRKFFVNQIVYMTNISEDSSVTVSSIIFDLKLLFLVWVLSAQIISNMSLMKILFNMFLTEPYYFKIERENGSNYSEIILTEALSLNNLSISVKLSSLDLFNLSHRNEDIRRKQIFALSLPGGHPYNWKNLSTKCLEILDNFNKELSSSLIKNTTSLLNNNLGPSFRPISSNLGEKLLLRQYNESFGVRNMTLFNNYEALNQNQSSSNELKITEIINSKITFFKNYISNLPGIYYMFTEIEITKPSYLLSESQPIIWIAQGLSKLVTRSLKEDQYGVVQDDLLKVIISLLELKATIDEITPIDLGGKKIDRNYVSIKNAIKRSLYQICTCFGDYMNDLTTDIELLKLLYNFVYYKEP